MLIHNASQLITLAGGPQRGNELGKLNSINEGAALIRSKEIIELGTYTKLMQKYPDEERLNMSSHAVLPGFVDPHMHLVWTGDRATGLEIRLQGKPTQRPWLMTGVSILLNILAAFILSRIKINKNSVETIAEAGE
jgi:imidazolonepropionase